MMSKMEQIAYAKRRLNMGFSRKSSSSIGSARDGSQ